MVILTVLDRRNRIAPSPSCFRLPHIAQVILILSSILLFVDFIIKMHTDIEGIIGQPINKSNPLLPVLDIAPITALVCLYNMLHLNNPRSCRSCRYHFRVSVDRGLIGMLYNRESRHQIRFLFLMSLTLAILAWGYYTMQYVNVSFNRKDTYFFILCPLLCYVISLIYYGMRYYTLWIYYCQNNDNARVLTHEGSSVRYIVVCEDKLLLNIPTPSGDIIFNDDMKIDVPLKVSLPFRENLTDHEAENYFKDASELKDVNIRLLFRSCDPGMYNNVFHYVAFVDDAEKAAETLKGQWFTLSETNEMIREGLVAMVLAAELSRIYTITMAWKAYDKSGHRLYEIKHYKPTFRLRDMHKWTVDYTDPNWLRVAQINEDKPFFRLRRFWHKITKGNAEN